jgi:MTH538 TIR-like domain (DUF1863)
MPADSSTKHRVFLSSYHKDEEYREQFERFFGDICIISCVHPGEIATDNSDEYIKRLIRGEYITSSSVVIVLVGERTHCRKHVDWEIHAGLIKSDGYSGLMGLMLPNYPGYEKNTYNPNTIPPRLQVNIQSEYALFYRWYNISKQWMKDCIQAAFEARETKNHLIDNSKLQFQRNRCD